MVALTRRKWLAALFGILLAAGPVLWFMSWLQSQGEAEASIAAVWSVRNADLAIQDTATLLNSIERRGIGSCQHADIQTLQELLFASGLIRELAVLGPRGETLCTNTGPSSTEREVPVATATSHPEIMLDLVRTLEGDRLLRVRRLSGQGKGSISAILRPKDLLPRLKPDGNPFAGRVRLTLADGTLLGTSGIGVTEDASLHGAVTSRAQSEVYGLYVTVTLIRNGVIANYDDLRRIGIVGSGVLALVILGCAVLASFRQDPGSLIEEALAADQFIPYYQPIIDVTSGKLLGAEVLVRWRKPDGTVVGPSGFIAFMEANDLVIQLTRSLMKQVRNELGPTLGQRPNIYVAFNVAPRHFEDSRLLNDVGEIFGSSPILFSQLVLELTERYELDDLAATHRVVSSLNSLGCRVALDDVGTGRNGLSYILRLGVNIIKIDKLFIDAVQRDLQSQTIVGTLVDLARSLQLQVVAEGVETFEQVNYLRNHGITAVQGYVFAPPLPGSAFLQLLQALAPAEGRNGDTQVVQERAISPPQHPPLPRELAS